GRDKSRNKTPKDLSRHPIVNGLRKYSKDTGILCIQCGELGHKKPECTGPALDWWGQSYLKELVWPQANSNFSRFSEKDSGLKYRDINDSVWRCHGQSSWKPENHDLDIPLAINVPNISYEEFTGTSYLESSKPKHRNQKRSERKVIRHLREIVGQQGKGSINYQKLAEDIKVEVSLINLFQMSPDLSKAFRSLSTRINRRLEKRRDFSGGKKKLFTEKANFEGSNVNYNSESLLGQAINSVGSKSLQGTSHTQADQGSEMIIVTVGFLKKLELSAKRLSRKGFEGLIMNVADGTFVELTHYLEFEMGVLGVWRKIEAFVRPFTTSNIDEVHLLLGMPWIHAVDAKIKIRESIIEIGDIQKGENLVNIEGSQFVESESHNRDIKRVRPEQVVKRQLGERILREKNELSVAVEEKIVQNKCCAAESVAPKRGNGEAEVYSNGDVPKLEPNEPSVGKQKNNISSNLGGISIGKPLRKYVVSEWYQDIVKYLIAGTFPESCIIKVQKAALIRKSASYSITSTGELLYCLRGMEKKCIAKEEVSRILQLAHDQGGNFSQVITRMKLEMVFWPSMAVDVRDYVKGCLTCSKFGTAIRIQTSARVVVSEPMELLGIHFTGPFPSFSGVRKRWILIAVDYFSRYIWTEAVERSDSDTIINFLKNAIFDKFGLPIDLYVDPGPHFGERTRNSAESCGTLWNNSPVAAKRAVGMIEKSVDILQKVLKKMTPDPKLWPERLSKATFEVNKREIAHLAYSPSEIFLGFNPSGPLEVKYKVDRRQSLGEVMKIDLGNVLPEDNEHADYVINFLAKRIDERKIILGIRGQNEYRPEELVMLYDHGQAGRKLRPTWRGPFVIVGFGGDMGKSYKLRQINGTPIPRHYHGDSLKKFRLREGDRCEFRSVNGILNRPHKSCGLIIAECIMAAANVCRSEDADDESSTSSNNET
ncbi:hypothetical protein EPUL_004130, partial [Erysiphe pulchra]